MKRILTAAAALLFLTISAPAFAIDSHGRDSRVDRRERVSVIDDVIRMTEAGVSDDAIIKQVRDSRDHFVVDADAVIALTNAHVSKPVLDAVMDNAYRPDNQRTTRRTTTSVYVRPYYAYDPWYYPYDPFWYGPRLSLGFGFGGWGRSYGRIGGGGGHFGGGHGRH
jgi:hypothetical protein